VLARPAGTAAHGVLRAVRVEVVEDRTELALGAALGREPVAEALELLVVVDGQIEDSACLVDALRDRFGVADRELLPRVGETPVERVLAET
jgi:hypothetical protein